MATNTDCFTPAQIKTLRAIRLRGKASGNTTMPLLVRLRERELIQRGDSRPVAKFGQRWVTAAGRGALDRAEAEEACRALEPRLILSLG